MSLSAGARVGPYEVVHLLGAGGMGEVYRARDTRLDRFVALEDAYAPGPGHAPPDRPLQRAKARAISRVSHPNICALHDIVDQDGQTFLIMELLDGETLGTRLEHGALPVERALTIAAQVADGLHAAHRNGVTHRDLTPSNIMLTRDGVKLLDFGLAKLTCVEPDPQAGTSSVHLTEEGSVLGTLPYMAPEQVEGRDVDARTDIFSLGVVLFGDADWTPAIQLARAAQAWRRRSSLRTRSRIVAARSTAGARSCCTKMPGKGSRGAMADGARPSVRAAMDSRQPDRPGRDKSSPERAESLALGRARCRARCARRRGSGHVWRHGKSFVSGKLDANSPRWLPVTFRAVVVSAARFAPDGDTIIYSAAWEGNPDGPS